MLTKQLTRFPGERQHTELFEKKQIKGLTMTKWPLNNPTIYGTYTLTFIEEPSFILRIPVKINGLANKTCKLLFKAQSSLV